MGSLLKRIRRTVGAAIIGEQFVTLTPTAWRAMTTEGFMALPDDVIGRMFRNVYGRVLEHASARAEEDGYYFTGAMNATAILWLASQMTEANGTEASYSVTGSLDGGKTQGAWSVYVCEGTLDTPDGVVIERAEDDPERITRLSIHTENPGYARWTKERPTSTDPKGEGM